ncbi:MAG: thymidine kinase [Chlorobi bacterium]|nr:thymidine kinase [Chlorobiota bacterium]
MFLEIPVNQHDNLGWVEVITGSMFSGKTEELIRRLRRAQIAKQKIEIFKPAVDNRYAEDRVVSHDMKEIPSKVVGSAREIFDLVNRDEVQVVGIDEAQFFDDEIVDVVNELANAGLRVIVAGLDMDFRGKPFGPMPYLMAIAEYVTKVHAICTETGNLAHYSYRKTAADDLIVVGEKQIYEPLSRAAFVRRMKQQKKEA